MLKLQVVLVLWNMPSFDKKDVFVSSSYNSPINPCKVVTEVLVTDDLVDTNTVVLLLCGH